ncbi:MAG: hypothetical protein L0Y71_21275 [Gemmataceae bacterium]|nr:hypothetical protein [Gemmataceae bacterium]
MKPCRLLLVLAVFSTPAAPVWAQADVLQVIPDDVMGFALINRVGQTSEKLTALAKRMKIDLPGNLLDMAKGALGVDKGFAEKGTVAIAAYPGKADDDEPRGLLFFPVTDYQAFIAGLQPKDPNAAITAITLKDGKAMVAGKRGNFAVLADADDREVLERALKATKNLATWAEPLSAWLTENDAAGVLTGHGLKLVSEHARKGLEEGRQNLLNLPPEAQFVGKFFDAVEGFFKSVETDVTHAGMGARVDAQGNLHFTARTVFAKNSGFAKTGAAVKPVPGGPLAGLPSGPFVLAFGGSVSENAMKSLMSMNSEILKSAGQNISAENLKKLEQAYEKMMTGVTGMSFVWQVGKEDQPLLASMAASFHTKDAAKYLADYEKSIAGMNEIFKELNVPFLPTYDVKKVKVGGKQALELTMDFAGGFGLPEEAQVMFKKLFGPDGKMTAAMAARDGQTIVMRYTKADGLKELLDGKTKGLADQAGALMVAKGFPPAGAQWLFYVSPKGATQFADRAVKSFLPIPINIPQFPETPPVGVAARINGQGFELHAVIPAGVVNGVGEFVDQLKQLFGGGV